MSKLAKLSLAHRSLIALLAIAAVAFGVVATGNLKQELIPSLQLPAASVVTTYPGASPQIVEQEVTEELESAIAGTDGLEEYTSTSSRGSSVVQATFDYDTDIDQTVADMQQKVNRLQLPDDADTTVATGSVDDFPVVFYSVTSELEPEALAERLEDQVVPELSQLDGVSDAQVSGARDSEIRITLDQDELTENGLTADAVNSALAANGISVPGGELTEDNKTAAVEVGSNFSSVKELRQLPIVPTGGAAAGSGTGETGAPQTGIPDETGVPPETGETGIPPETAQAPEPVQLSDVAEVRETLAESTSITRANSEPSVGLSITKDTDASTVTVAEDVSESVADLEDELADDTTFTVVFDQAPFIQESITALTEEGLLGLGMAILVILVFLLSVRSTVVTALSIPFSLVIALLGLYGGGYSLNILTLGALTVSIGRVVDDSIVVLENIKRHLGYGEEKREAILAGVREVAGAITSSTLATVAVFLPLAFVGDEVGELFRPFAVTATVALLASLLVALTIIPVLAYWFLKRPRGADRGEQAQARVREKALRAEQRNPLQRAYVPIIRFTTRFRVLTILAGIAIFVGTMAMAPLMKTNFLDMSGQGTLSVTQTMPKGTSLERTDEAASKVEQVLEDTDGIDTYQVTVGAQEFAGFSLGSGTDEATYTAATEDDLDADEQRELVSDVRKDLNDLDGVGALTVSEGDQASMGGQLEVVVEANDDDALSEASEQVADAMRDIDGTADVTNNQDAEVPSIQVDVDREAAAEVGLAEATIGEAVRQQFQGASTEAVLDDTTTNIVVRDGAAPDNLNQLRNLDLQTPTGQTVELSEVADVTRQSAPASLSRIDGVRSATVSASAESSDLGTVNTELQTELDELDLPAGASAEIGGVGADQEESFGQMGLALLAAMAIVFLVLVGTFRSIAQSLVLMVSVPFAATGSIGLLLLTDTPLGLPGLIGMLMLIGIVVTNAIVLIDLINTYREQGMGLRQAVIDGGRRRLRPILMTALATICALIPMSLGITGGGVLISGPLAIVVIGGLISSTLLTLVLVPTLYTMVEGAKERIAARRERPDDDLDDLDGPDEAYRAGGRHSGATAGAAGAAGAGSDNSDGVLVGASAGDGHPDVSSVPHGSQAGNQAANAEPNGNGHPVDNRPSDHPVPAGTSANQPVPVTVVQPANRAERANGDADAKVTIEVTLRRDQE